MHTRIKKERTCEPHRFHWCWVQQLGAHWAPELWERVTRLGISLRSASSDYDVPIPIPRLQVA
jgi:hypothetical protein